MRTIAALFVCTASMCAQDPFEIHVYEYEPLPRGEFTYEAHMNCVARGSTSDGGAVAATNHQFHFASELTAGITDWFRGAAVLLTAVRPDHSLDYAGFRVLPHFYAPASWHLPLNLGLVAEFSFQREIYEENSRVVELRPIIEKHLGRLELDANPVFARALRGPARRDGWSFEPSGRIGWRMSKALTPSVEYYSSWGSIQKLPPTDDQIHQIFPGVDVRFGEHLTWNLGVGIGITSTGSSLILKSRFEIPFGRPHVHN